VCVCVRFVLFCRGGFPFVGGCCCQRGPARGRRGMQTGPAQGDLGSPGEEATAQAPYAPDGRAPWYSMGWVSFSVTESSAECLDSFLPSSALFRALPLGALDCSSRTALSSSGSLISHYVAFCEVRPAPAGPAPTRETASEHAFRSPFIHLSLNQGLRATKRLCLFSQQNSRLPFSPQHPKQVQLLPVSAAMDPTPPR